MRALGKHEPGIGRASVANFAVPDPELRKARILVIDDHLANTVLLERALRGAGFSSVRSTNDSHEGFRLAREFDPDLVILDLRMPGRDGFEILEALISGDVTDEYVPVIVLTADRDRDAKHRALAMGADDFVTKPFDLEEVVLRARNLLRTRVLYRRTEERNRVLTLASRRKVPGLRRRIEDVIERREFRPVFQPIVDLTDNSLIGSEALTRFADGTQPSARFREADAVGLGPRLELACLRSALDAAHRLPASSWVSLNVGPPLLEAGEALPELLAETSRAVVLEVTEHARVEDYPRLREARAQLPGVVRIAIDDAGAGFSSMRHIVELQPDYVKIDIGLVRNIDEDGSRQALVSGMAYFAEKTGCTLIAEGIETEQERDRLLRLGVRYGQGYLLGVPAPIPA